MSDKMKTGREVAYCKRCGRRLKDEQSKERGYGDVCFRKMQASRIRKPLWKLNEKVLDSE